MSTTSTMPGPSLLLGATSWADPDDIRTIFSTAMSEMYQREVPLYADLLDLVRDVNQQAMDKDPALKASLEQRSELERLHLERHGAIRVGTAEEVRMLSRMFRLMNMEPVSYYDLSTAGLPVHATAFRPTTQESLDKNPFRLFTSLLRLELIADPAVRDLAQTCLAKRQIFSPLCVEMVVKAEEQGGLSPEDSVAFVRAALETFKWHSQSRITKEEYDTLASAHKLAADVCAFQSCHINHLTPRTLDMEAVQQGMADRGIPPKAIIEGPPPLPCPILLRQTSFLAMTEAVQFLDSATGSLVTGHHQARFGEIEQRSLALTTKGRSLYMRLLAEAQQQLPAMLIGSPAHSKTCDLNQMNEVHLLQYFSSFPSTYEEIRKQELGFFRYSVSPASASLPPFDPEEVTLDDLVEAGHVTYEPLLYEDFLPSSAAGIFQSNLGQKAQMVSSGPDQAAFEAAIGRRVLDEMDLYEASQQESIDAVASVLGVGSRLYA